MVHIDATRFQSGCSSLLLGFLKINNRSSCNRIHKTPGFLFNPVDIIVGRFFPVAVFVWTVPMDCFWAAVNRPGMPFHFVSGLFFCGRRCGRLWVRQKYS